MMHLLILATATPPPTTSAPSRSLFDYVAAGGEVGFIIILLSLIAVALVITQLISIRRSNLAPEPFVKALSVHLQDRDAEAAAHLCTTPGQDSFIARVVGSALVRCNRSAFGFLELRSSLEEAQEREVARLERATDVIGLIASVAPMLGLLGTVVGMVGAFDALTLSEGPAKPDQLAGNISQALVTTVLGLIVAIPATAMYTYLRNRIESLATDIGITIEELTAHLEVTPAGSGSKPAAPPTAPRPTPSGDMSA